MPIENLDTVIEKHFQEQVRGVVISSLLSEAEKITLGDLSEWVAQSERYGPHARSLTLQDIFEAYNLSQFGKIDESEPVQEVEVAKPRGGRKKGSGKKKGGKKKKSVAKKPRKKTGNDEDIIRRGGGSAEKGREVNFRDTDAKKRYQDGIRDLIEAEGGGPISSSEIVERSGGSLNQVRMILLGLVREGTVVHNGKARATRYYWRENATDEVMSQFERELNES
jgi:uncharacterized protein (DUF1330 family)